MYWLSLMAFKTPSLSKKIAFFGIFFFKNFPEELKSLGRPISIKGLLKIFPVILFSNFF